MLAAIGSDLAADVTAWAIAAGSLAGLGSVLLALGRAVITAPVIRRIDASEAATDKRLSIIEDRQKLIMRKLGLD